MVGIFDPLLAFLVFYFDRHFQILKSGFTFGVAFDCNVDMFISHVLDAGGVTGPDDFSNVGNKWAWQDNREEFLNDDIPILGAIFKMMV
jgi:hypothetical protein